MTHLAERLLAGYRSFMAGRYQVESSCYRVLARDGQEPETMVIALALLTRSRTDCCVFRPV